VTSLSVVVPATNAPPTLAACLEALRSSTSPPDELIVVETPPRLGPAGARNLGARRAEGDVLVFVDSDVLVHADALARLRAWFDGDDPPDAVFGSYDDAPAAHGVVSSFRNLLHHHVHQESGGVVASFWAGLGAVRKSRFDDVGGFDEERYPHSSVEDIELGVRLAAAGARIVLDPTMLGTHLKRWTLAEMARTDLFRRGIPWIELMLRHRRLGGDLNLSWRHRASTVAVAGGVLAALARRRALVLAAAGAFVALNARFYGVLRRKRGAGGAVAGVGLHALHHALALMAVPAGLVLHLLRRAFRRD
jgi:GT2 family glycosyltransferase